MCPHPRIRWPSYLPPSRLPQAQELHMYPRKLIELGSLLIKDLLLENCK